ncbi:MAG: hypothetical protein ONB46_05410 [candidate division KSB1 bacterium]|nr:hypothetical protein [candidate division KSB1 bacterium]MDZ7365456.1 hypothetical protein [candidate division KSB1 bacterium]MDZ7403497.1 hypothetical protein [candidate division KSB1 bacterium]
MRRCGKISNRGAIELNEKTGAAHPTIPAFPLLLCKEAVHRKIEMNGFGNLEVVTQLYLLHNVKSKILDRGESLPKRRKPLPRLLQRQRCKLFLEALGFDNSHERKEFMNASALSKVSTRPSTISRSTSLSPACHSSVHINDVGSF